MRFAKWMVPFSASEYSQILQRPLRSKSAASDGVPVRVRSPAFEFRLLFAGQPKFLYPEVDVLLKFLLSGVLGNGSQAALHSLTGCQAAVMGDIITEVCCRTVYSKVIKNNL